MPSPRVAHLAPLAAFALGLGLSLWSSLAAAAEPSQEIRELAGEAEALLDALQPKEALRILEQGSRRASYSKADKKSRARLWVILGRARAELSDEPGMEQAFRQAVALDPSVRLSKANTSPKIIAALERIRLEAPVVKKPTPPPPPPPRPKAPPSPTPAPSPVLEKDEPAALAWWIEGPMISGARVRLVVDTSGLAPAAVVEGHRRDPERSQTSRIELVRSSTTVTAVLDLDARPFEVWLTARTARGLVARAGSPETPIRFAPRPAPSLTEAWSARTPAPPPPRTESSTVAASLLGAAPEAEGGDATGDPVTLALTFGMILIMAGAVALSIALLAGGSDCDAGPGFGCSEVRVLPLTRF